MYSSDELLFEHNVVRLPVKSGRHNALPISCFIIAKNEEARIGSCIASVIDWVDEVIVVDSGSSDRTVDIARQAGAKVVYKEWLGFGQQKRFGESLCRNPWVLNLDADEIAPPDLKHELRQIFNSNETEFAAYRLPVHIVYPGRETAPSVRKGPRLHQSLRSAAGQIQEFLRFMIQWTRGISRSGA